MNAAAEHLQTRSAISTHIHLVGSCSNLTDGKQFHARVVELELDTDCHLRKHLVEMYIRCGSPEDSWEVFYDTPSLSRDIVTWTRITSAYNHKGLRHEARQVYRFMQLEGVKPDVVSYLPVLDACAGLQSLPDGRRVHADITEARLHGSLTLNNSLINMYGKCGSFLDARKVFEKLHHRDVVSWTSIFTACSESGDSTGALQLFHTMQLDGVQPNRIAFLGALSACNTASALEEGKKIHLCIREAGCDQRQNVGNAIVTMYGKCGDAEAALDAFNRLPARDVVSWTALIAAYVQQARVREAFQAVHSMQLEGIKPNKVTFVTIFNACDTPTTLTWAKRLHDLVLEGGFESEIMVGNSLVNMYGKCGRLEDARALFERMPRRDAITWNSIISAYAHRMNDREPLLLFQQMEAENITPNRSTFATVLYACARLKALDEGKAIHTRLVEAGLDKDVVAGTAVVNLYAKCGSLDEARQVFESIKREDVISWNAMIGAYSEQGLLLQAMELLQRMEAEGMVPNEVTYVSILKGCNSPKALDTGRQIHDLIIKMKFDKSSNLVVRTALLGMFVKCGSLEDAEEVFEGMQANDVVSWSVMIGAYAQQRERVHCALQLFRRMQQNGVAPDKIIFAVVLAACSGSSDTLPAGKMIHTSLAGSYVERELDVENALLRLYGRCKCLREAREVFDSMEERDRESWNEMLAAYTSEGQYGEVLRLFEIVEDEAQAQDILKSKVVLASIANSCGNLNAHAAGSRVHRLVEEAGLQQDVVAGTALIAMHGRFGCLEAARRVFDAVTESSKDLVMWTAIIAAYAHNGHSRESLDLFLMFQQEGLEPDDVLFVAVLSACSTAGLAEQGVAHFVSMTMDYGLKANQQHFGCMIDLLGRTGRLVEAELLMQTMPDSPDAMSWMSMLSGCKIHSDVERGKRLMERALLSCTEVAAAYIVLSDIHRAPA